MNVNLDVNINNILFLEYMKKKDNENGEFDLHLVEERGRNKPILQCEFDFSSNIPRL